MTAVKFDQEKLRYDLIPPEVEHALAAVLTFGAKKYGDRNWEQGLAWNRVYAALRRHIAAWYAAHLNGEYGTDPETGLSHLAHAACCIAFLLTYEARERGTDDRPCRSEEQIGMHVCVTPEDNYNAVSIAAERTGLWFFKVLNTVTIAMSKAYSAVQEKPNLDETMASRRWNHWRDV